MSHEVNLLDVEGVGEHLLDSINLEGLLSLDAISPRFRPAIRRNPRAFNLLLRAVQCFDWIDMGLFNCLPYGNYDVNVGDLINSIRYYRLLTWWPDPPAPQTRRGNIDCVVRFPWDRHVVSLLESSGFVEQTRCGRLEETRRVRGVDWGHVRLAVTATPQNIVATAVASVEGCANCDVASADVVLLVLDLHLMLNRDFIHQVNALMRRLTPQRQRLVFGVVRRQRMRLGGAQAHRSLELLHFTYILVSTYVERTTEVPWCVCFVNEEGVAEDMPVWKRFLQLGCNHVMPSQQTNFCSFHTPLDIASLFE